MKRKKLVIISHTKHFKKNGEIVGWGATINEVNYLADYWEEVVHIACLYKSEAPNSSLPYNKSNIKFVPIPPYGGKKLLSKLLIFCIIPIIVFKVYRGCRNASEVQLRLPTSMGLFLLPLFSYFIPRKFIFWVKYAGDWGQIKPPLANRIQRYWLKKNWTKCKVTINGFWKNQPAHCFSFENPCLKQDDVISGKLIAQEKDFQKPYNFCFVGRLSDVKGISDIISSFRNVPEEAIKKIHIIGDGEEIERYKGEATYLGDKIIFHGFQNKEYVHSILKSVHFFLLPSRAEGFPKVVAEAACYGVIPVVSDVGSIAHYINSSNGFLWKIKKSKDYETVLLNALSSDKSELQNKSKEILELAKLFTFDNYLNKLNANVL